VRVIGLQPSEFPKVEPNAGLVVTRLLPAHAALEAGVKESMAESFNRLAEYLRSRDLSTYVGDQPLSAAQGQRPNGGRWIAGATRHHRASVAHHQSWRVPDSVPTINNPGLRVVAHAAGAHQVPARLTERIIHGLEINTDGARGTADLRQPCAAELKQGSGVGVQIVMNLRTRQAARVQLS
jgi:hypothetical protein